MPPWIEVGKLVYPVEHIGDELAQKEPWRDAGASTKAPGDGSSKVGKIGVFDEATDAVWCGSLIGEEISHTGADGGERRKVKALKPNLDCARIVEARIGGKVCMQALCERRKPLNALRPFEESHGPGDNEV